MQFDLLLLQSRLPLFLVLRKKLTVRIHSGVLAHTESWIRLWYLVRGLDAFGRGAIKCKIGDLCRILAVSKPTLYEWLRKGKKLGGFKIYKTKAGITTIYLTSLPKLAQVLGIKDFGAIAEISLFEICTLMGLRSTATAIAAQKLQQQSSYAAYNSLSSTEKKSWRIPSPDDLLGDDLFSSPQLEKGFKNFIIHRGQDKMFVSSGFIPFGCKQERIASERRISVSTVQRHLNRIGINRRQIIQAKAGYGEIANAIEWESPLYTTGSISFPVTLGMSPDGELLLTESNGYTSSKHSQYKIHRGRIFKYQGRYWIYRCNVYGLEYRLTSMRKTRKLYKSLICQKGAIATSYSSGKLIGRKSTARSVGGNNFSLCIDSREKEIHCVNSIFSENPSDQVK